MYCSIYYKFMLTFFIEMLANLLQTHTPVNDPFQHYISASP